MLALAGVGFFLSSLFVTSYKLSLDYVLRVSTFAPLSMRYLNDSPSSDKTALCRGGRESPSKVLMLLIPAPCCNRTLATLNLFSCSEFNIVIMPSSELIESI